MNVTSTSRNVSPVDPNRSARIRNHITWYPRLTQPDATDSDRTIRDRSLERTAATSWIALMATQPPSHRSPNRMKLLPSDDGCPRRFDEERGAGDRSDPVRSDQTDSLEAALR